MYVEHLISAALSQAINPVATRLYAEQGAPAVVALKQRVLAPLTVVCLGLVAGALVAGTDFVHLVAGHDKLASAPVFVLATVCLLLQPMMSIAGMGLLLVKRSSTVFVLTAGVALLNVALNLWLIPRHGIMGATAAVCASQLLLQAALWVACPAELRCGLPMGVLARSTALAGLVVAVGWGTNLFGLPSPLLRLGAAALLLLLLFVLPMWRLEPSLRTVARRGLAG
jgi:O-antigen/teichoic acid export membrane protein